MSYPAVAALFRSDDFREGPKAFAQKRAPQWKGR
jgi:enoyl-CoA hydratase/carnithine racemase